MSTDSNQTFAILPAFADDEPTLTEQRRHPRRTLNVAAIFASEFEFLTYTGVIEDVSLGGLFLATEQLLPLGTIVALIFSVPNSDRELEAKAEVRWLRHPGSPAGRPGGLGLMFIELPRPSREAIAWVIDR